MNGLHVASKLTLPIEMVGESTAILAKKGAGKSNTAKVIVEETLDHGGVQVIVLDPIGLRRRAAGALHGGNMNAQERRKLYAEQVGPDALSRQLRSAAPKCRSCTRPMRWVTTNRGRKMPVDFDPHEAGNVVVDANGRAEVYRETPSTIPDGSTLHFSHFATCPNADEHRRSK